MVNIGVLYAITAGVGALTIAAVLNRLKATKYKDNIDVKLKQLLTFLMVFCVADMIWGLLTSRLLLVNRLVYTVSTYSFHLGAAFSAFLWVGYVIHYLQLERKYVVVLNVCRGIFLAVQLGVLFSNIWTGIFFEITKEAEYVSHELRNFMFFMQFAYYICLILYCSIKYGFFFNNKDVERETVVRYRTALLYSCVPLVFGFCQMLWSDAPMYSLGFMLTAVLIYSFNITSQREEYLEKIYKDENIMLNDLAISLSEDFQSVYYIDLETNTYDEFGNSEFYNENVNIKIVHGEDFFEDLKVNIPKVVVPEDQKRVLNSLTKENIERELRNRKSFSFNYRIMTLNGDKYYLIKIIRPVNENTDERGRRLVVGVFDDDERVRKEMMHKEALQEALEATRKASQAKSDFLFSMSHDIRTPLNSILGFNELAKKHMDDRKYLADCLDKVSMSGNHLLSLVNDVLDMSKIEAGKLELIEKPECIRTRNEQLVTIIKELAFGKSIDFKYEYVNLSAEYIVCDALRLNQILLNILSNAVKYTPVGGKITYTIEQKEILRGDRVSLSFKVSDTGIGMSEEFLSRIFDVFERERNSTMSGVEGTGLGMSIVKQLVEMMQGTISVDSRVGSGTTVECLMVFPMAKGIPDEEEGQEEIVSFPEGKRVLIVDDNVLNREIGCELLKDMNLLVEEASDGQEALDMIAHSAPGYFDAVLIDVQMPIMDGYEATRRIRALDNAQLANIPIIAMTANSFEEDKKNAFEAGMNEHLSKPVNPKEVAATLSKLIL